MKKIRINGVEGYYYVEDNTLIYNYESIPLKDVLENKTIKSVSDIEFNECQVSDLNDFTICQYNKLVSELNKHHPKYAIDYLEGRFI